MRASVQSCAIGAIQLKDERACSQSNPCVKLNVVIKSYLKCNALPLYRAIECIGEVRAYPQRVVLPSSRRAPHRLIHAFRADTSGRPTNEVAASVRETRSLRTDDFVNAFTR